MMPIERQVCSLELAKRLRDLGVKQESLWYWVIGHPKLDAFLTHYEDYTGPNIKSYSAFTVAELGEMLPVAPFHCECYVSKGQRKRLITERITSAFHTEFSDTEADARAKMLIYLIEQKLVTP